MTVFARLGESEKPSRDLPTEGSSAQAPTAEARREWLDVFMRAVQTDLRSTADHRSDSACSDQPSIGQIRRFFVSRDHEVLRSPCHQTSRRRRREYDRFASIMRAERSSALSERASSERTLGGRYFVERELGHGGSGTVYEVREVDSAARMALKVLHEDAALNGRALKEEFRQLSEIVHPNLVSLYELSFDGEHWSIAMELVVGQRFDDYVRGNILRLRAALRQLVDGLTALHRAGKLHHDIKPQNILVTSSGRVVILDIGLIKTDCEKPDFLERRGSGCLVYGTAAYMAPERVEGAPPSAASDWYSVGIVLYEALTNRLPYDGPWHQVLRNKPAAPPIPASHWANDVPRDLDRLCQGLLEPDPRRRIDETEICLHVHGVRRVLDAKHVAESAPIPAVFVGREKPLQQLRDAFERVTRGQTTVMFIHGGTGTGKTALMARFLDWIEHEKAAVVLRGRCSEREYMPYKMLDDLVDCVRARGWQVPGSDDALDVRSGSLADSLLDLQRARIASPQNFGWSDRRDLTSRVAAALKESWKYLGEQGRIVIAVDDLQWGDADSAKVLRALFAEPDTPPLLFVGVYRSEYSAASKCLRCIHRYCALRRRDIHIEQIPLRPLTDTEADKLVREISRAQARVSAALHRSVKRESRGMPFLLTGVAELARSPRWLTEPRPKRLTLKAMLVARILQLSPEARRVLDAVSVAGGPVEQGIALGIAGLSKGDRAVFQELRAGRLVRTSGARPSDLVEPYHAVISETVVRELSPEQRRGLQNRLSFAAGGDRS